MYAYFVDPLQKTALQNIFAFLFIFSMFMQFSIPALAQEPSGPRLTTDLNVNGRSVRVVDENPYEITQRRVRDGHGRTHTVRAYGSMWLTFMGSMIATELWYCSNQHLPWIANNQETPNCRDELMTMLLDPGMSLGVLAMTATTLSLRQQGNKHLSRFAQRLARHHSQSLGGVGRIRKVFKLTQTVFEHLAMGAGMMVQTSIASTYNSPYMRECLVDIKDRIRGQRQPGSDEADADAVTAAIDTSLAGGNCTKAKDYFFNSENGTSSEIYITVISIGASSVIAGAATTVIRLVGFALLRFTPAGNALTIGGLVAANVMIDFVDRVLEPIIRQAYHMNRSKRHLSYSFNELLNSLNDYKNSGELIRTYERRTTCAEMGEQHIDLPATCARWATETVHASKLLDDLKTHKYNIDYRRRSNLNRFMEAQSRWSQKVSTTLSHLSTFQNIMRRLLAAREQERLNPDANTHHYLSVLTKTNTPEEFSVHLSAPPESRIFTQNQITQLYAVMNQMRNRISASTYDQNIEIRILFERLHLSIHENNRYKTHSILWSLKKAFANSYLSRLDYTNYVRTGSPFTPEEISTVDRVITSMVTSFNPISARSYREFTTNQLDFLEPIDSTETPDEIAAATPSAPRRGVSLNENDPLTSLLLANKDDGFDHYDQPQFWTDRDNRGIPSMTVPGRILTHLACGDFSSIHFAFVDGRESRVMFPNILKDPSKMNCSVSRATAHFPLVNGYYPAFDFWPNPSSQDIVRLLPDPALHDIYQYNNMERVGLLNILADPNTELRWANQAEFDQYWQNELWPKVSEFLVRLKADYFVTIGDYFDINFGCRQRGLLEFFSRDRFCDSGYSISQPLTDAEVQMRIEGYFNSADKSYYSTIGLAESFLDELRTYAYVLEKTSGANDSDRGLLLSLAPAMHSAVNSLNVSGRDLHISVSDLTHEQRIEWMSVPGVYQVLGDSAIQSFVTHYTEVQSKVAERIQALTATGLTLEAYQNPDQLRQYPAADVIKLQIYSDIDTSLHYMMKNLLEDYLGGNNIIYITHD